MKNPYEILEELKRVFPDKLPQYREYTQESTLVAIGRQEVIRLFEALLERSD